ncbi:MAG TPA: hypothetical protein VMY78_16230 [Solirubrobacteraceae bacterium]|nr:hypothetical protein [Solirubrobacteraceae bacterium]
MHRLSSVIGLVLVALCAATGFAVAETPDPAKPPELAAAIESCTTNAMPAGRVVSFVGSMPTITGAERMRMRFDLERLRPRDAHWRRLLGVPGFGGWESTDPGRAGFVFHKRVDGLQVPASYRAIVRFRWDDTAGRIVRRASRVTASCAQPDVRPNLVPGALTAVFDARPGLAVYKLVVRNTGRSEAGAFSVRVGGGKTDVAGLRPRQQRTVVVISPVCLAGTTVLAEVDADHVIDEARERGNEVARRCPLWGG